MRYHWLSISYLVFMGCNLPNRNSERPLPMPQQPVNTVPTATAAPVSTSPAQAEAITATSTMTSTQTNISISNSTTGQPNTPAPETSVQADTPQAPQPAARQTPIERLTDSQKIRLFASASSSAYCGDDTNCAVKERFRQASININNPFRIDGWIVAFIAARNGRSDVEGYVFYESDSPDVIIAFRGSEDNQNPGAINDWINVNFQAGSRTHQGRRISGQVHQGFLDATLDLWQSSNQTNITRLIAQAKLERKTFWLTGHSQGAAISVLVAMRLFEDGIKLKGVYAFGLPRLAGEDFQRSYNSTLGSITRVFANQRDPVPHVPPQFRPVGQNVIFWPPNVQNLGEAGVPAWDLLSAALNGNLLHHSLNDLQNGYFSALK